MPDSTKDLNPLTAREALLAILLVIQDDHRQVSGYPSHLETLRAIERQAREGLDRRGMENFELSDQLADRLAEAHAALRESGNWETDHETAEMIAKALALPPDLEAMVERRIGLR
jgi:hypothetical protein